MDGEGRAALSPWRMPWRAWKEVGLRCWRESSDDNVGLVAAGVAFYGFLALVPLLGAVVLTYGLFVEPATVIRHIQALAAVLPDDIALSVGTQLLQVVQTSDGKKGLGLLIALAVALFGARNGAGALITALNIAYEEEEKRGFIRINLMAVAITACAVLAAIVAAVALAALGALPALLPFANDALLFVGTGLSYVLLALVGAAGAAALYRFAPARSAPKWVWITPGSLFASILWLALSLGFGTYVAYIGKFDATYGSLGAVVALMTWLYLSSYILLLGAELNAEFEHQTAQDTTTGAPRPLGERRAWVADHVAGERAPAVPETRDGAAPAQRVKPPAAKRRPASEAAMRVGPSPLGWITSSAAVLGLAMLRRPGRRAAGVALLSTAVGLAMLPHQSRAAALGVK